jgi:hypothetical protein
MSLTLSGLTIQTSFQISIACNFIWQEKNATPPLIARAAALETLQ